MADLKTIMKTLKENSEKNTITDLAWKELIEAIQPAKIEESEVAKKNLKNRIQHHPAIITTLEMSNWEIFG